MAVWGEETLQSGYIELCSDVKPYPLARSGRKRWIVGHRVLQPEASRLSRLSKGRCEALRSAVVFGRRQKVSNFGNPSRPIKAFSIPKRVIYKEKTYGFGMNKKGYRKVSLARPWILFFFHWFWVLFISEHYQFLHNIRLEQTAWKSWFFGEILVARSALGRCSGGAFGIK